MKVSRKRGNVKVMLPGALEYVELGDSASVPVNSLVSASRGTVAVTSARNLSGGTQTARFSGGTFRLAQRRSSRPITDLVMAGGNFRQCSASSAGRSVATTSAAAHVAFGDCGAAGRDASAPAGATAPPPSAARSG